MFIRIVLVVFSLVGFGAFGAVASACNDDSESLTLEEYFEQVGKLDDDMQQRSDEIEQELEALGEDATPDQVADSFQEQVDLLEEFQADLDDIEAPAEVEETHDTVVTALDAAVDQFDELVSAFREAETVEEGFEQFDDSDFAAIEEADQACRELEQIAADNGIEADFDCGGEA